MCVHECESICIYMDTLSIYDETSEIDDISPFVFMADYTLGFTTEPLWLQLKFYTPNAFSFFSLSLSLSKILF